MKPFWIRCVNILFLLLYYHLLIIINYRKCYQKNFISLISLENLTIIIVIILSFQSYYHFMGFAPKVTILIVILFILLILNLKGYCFSILENVGESLETVMHKLILMGGKKSTKNSKTEEDIHGVIDLFSKVITRFMKFNWN